MGAQMETVKDSEGNSHVIFDESSLYDDSQMGENLSDFEILQVLSEDGSSFVAKVKSKVDHKLYAMKMIDFSLIKEQKEKELSLNEKDKIKQNK